MIKQSRRKKDKCNWAVTIILFLIVIGCIIGPLYMTVVIALKTPQEMADVLALPRNPAWENFRDAWIMTNYPRKLGNTLFITAINLVFTVFTNAIEKKQIF